MHGFGAAMTDASAELLSELPDDKRKAIMAELFGRANGGLGLSFTRLTVGASDFSTSDYSYDDTPGNAPDPELRHFSIDAGEDIRPPAHPRSARDQSRPAGDDQPVERAGVDEDDAQPDQGPARPAILSSRSRTILRARSRRSGARACRFRCSPSRTSLTSSPTIIPGCGSIRRTAQ